jgi:hypothetical protein
MHLPGDTKLAIFRNISLILVAFWLGAAIFFSSVVAPAAFSALRSYQVTNASEIAGAIVNRSLSVINIGGFVIGSFALLIAFMWRGERTWFLLETVALALLTVMTAVGHWVIAARIRAIRTALSVPIDQLGIDHPQRIAFANLHRYSVIALSVAMIAALIASLLFARNTQR